ncbi:hypothetical protein ABH926_002444 [Catenulispora sp. GP43]|uniref:hypothetical protein n=1 Tax=Catenulispora sp. GP43 TaxID=3156263 RepID=UPI003512BD45
MTPVLAVIVMTAWLQTAPADGSAASPAPGSALGGGDITVSTVMAPGSLVISVPLRLPALAGRLQPIVITDNRTEDPGWTVTAILTGRPSADALGWNPNLLGSAPGESIVLGPKTGPRPGLGQPRILASAAPGASLGTTRLDAALSANAPAAATFTLTAI